MQQADHEGSINWLRRPSPLPQESLAGFLGRWARLNEMSSRRVLLDTAHLSCAIRVSALDMPKIAAFLQIDLSTLQSIAPVTEPTCAVLRSNLTRPTTEAVCPQCLKESAHSRQLWSHCLATACPDHACRLFDRCQVCRDSIRHDRPLPQLCDCGADLSVQVAVPATKAEVDFSLLLMGEKPIDSSIPLHLGSGVPAQIDLYIFGLANHFASTGSGSSPSKAGKLRHPKAVDEAIERLILLFALFEDWPHRFDDRLKRLMASTSSVASTGVAARYGRWFRFLFRTYRHDAFRPVSEAAANRITLSHDGLLNARTSSIANLATVEKQWFSVKEAASELSVSVARINDGIDRYLIHARDPAPAVDYRQRFLSAKEIARLRKVQFEHIDDAFAIALLCVPKAVYGLMCEAGWIARDDPNDIAPVVSGYIQHVPLLALIEKLRTWATENTRRKIVESIRLRELNFRRTTNHSRLVALFRAIAAGELTPVDHDAHFTIGELMFAQDEVDQRIASWFVERGLTVQQVSALTGAHFDAVKNWVDMKLLPASREPLEQGAPWVIDLRDLISFLQTYSSLAWQAKVCQSSSRGLTSRLNALGVTPIEPEDGRGAIVKLGDLFSAVERLATKCA